MRFFLNLLAAALVTYLVAAPAMSADSVESSTAVSETDTSQDRSASGKDNDLWPDRTSMFAIWKGILAKAPRAKDGSLAATNRNRPFTYEEQAYDKPSRDWWWSAANLAVVVLGAMVITYVTGGVIVPWLGGTIGGLSGLSGAAAVSKGLAWLGGGAIAAGGFGVAGGTAIILVMTDLAISTALEYSLRGLKTDDRFKDLSAMIKQLDVNQDQSEAWPGLEREAAIAATKDYVLTTHAVATACMRWAADENLERTVTANDNTDHELTIAMTDRQRVLIVVAIRLLEEARRLQPESSLVHHALGNAYWWLSVRGGYVEPAPQDESLAMPHTSLLSRTDADELGCLQAAVWHYAQGVACEPRNVNVRINWANALQADGTLHEAISVIAGGLPHISTCKDEDKAALLRTNGMLQYQAFTRSTLWAQFESGGGFPSLQDSPLLLASMESYTKALEYDPSDLTSLMSLAQVYQDAGATPIGESVAVMPVAEVQFRVIEEILKKEKVLASIERSQLPASYRPGQLLDGYRGTLRWAFDSLANSQVSGKRLERLHAAADSWLAFVAQNDLKMRPMSRAVLLKVQAACKAYNEDVWLPGAGYALKTIDHELSKQATDP